ncbi:hypothetical protein O1611_g801 [Lasiodiplodia mahajangana]|uniref:Uncharacterized protein n=1 Tax=Lasiodiplodia mahajangana TaxID=1108764 RepID=A0ACC2JZD2_9PEZI|nr:hypothetical protein O1611_g801 [Lasiodiplodia mahajangana]
MSEFWAGYISGVAGIIIGNPLDIVKVRLQAQPLSSRPLPAEPTLPRYQHASLISSSSNLLTYQATIASPITKPFQIKSFVTGTKAPILGYGGLNGVLFLAYNRTEDTLNRTLSIFPTLDAGGSTTGSNLWTVWLAGAVGGVATCFISTPTELIKCRAQLASQSQGYSPNPTLAPHSSSSWHIARSIWRNEGFRGFYHGGVVTTLRDSIGYGFYFWAYHLSGRIMASISTGGIGGNSNDARPTGLLTQETVKTLLCGGVAGVLSWASVFPLDYVKTRVQQQVYSPPPHNAAATPLLGTGTSTPGRKGAVQIAKEAYREGGMRVFFRGLGWCSMRAFCVNAVQWFVYEQIMLQLGQSNQDRRKESHY